jgi:hypothetical protein
MSRIERVATTGTQLSFGRHVLTKRRDYDSASEEAAPIGEPQLSPGLTHRSGAVQFADPSHMYWIIIVIILSLGQAIEGWLATMNRSL